jgi:NAD(P)-dependent dehydrogenase (short-subunit alcohol dehydrogenase family)
MHNILITGGTRGIGLGLARAFLDLGCNVTICGRSQAAVDAACGALATSKESPQVFGAVCDVTNFEQVQRLWQAAGERFGTVDIWINNAGLSNPLQDFQLHSPAHTAAVVQTNLQGAMYGCQVALQGMQRQGHGFIYNMEGFGSNGQRMRGLTLYGCTKYALAYLTDSLVLENRGGKVKIGAIRPGMVVTDLLLKDRVDNPAQWARSRRIFNILADTVETVTPWIARQVLSNQRHGHRICWLTQRKILWRFLTASISGRKVAGL